MNPYGRASERGVEKGEIEGEREKSERGGSNNYFTRKESQTITATKDLGKSVA